MAIVNVLAQEIVQIVVQGVAAAQAAFNAVRAATAGVGTAAAAAQGFVSRMAGAMVTGLRAPSSILYGLYQGFRQLHRVVEGLAGVARRIAFGGGLGLAGLITGAARGTREGEQFHAALTRLVRTLGDAFAPVVRVATASLGALTDWFRTLDDATKSDIAQWALMTAGAAAFVAVLPVIVAGIGSVVGILSFLLSPAALAIGAIAALAVAVGRMFDFFQTGGADMADSLNESNQTWLGALVKGIGAVVTAMARMFNWIMQQATKVSDWIAVQMAKAGEFFGVLPQGTAEELGKMPPIQPPQIDVGAVDNFFGKVQRGANAAVIGFEDLIGAIKGPGGLLDMKGLFGGSFRPKLAVEFESVGDTFTRLQKNLLAPANDIDKQQLEQQQKMVEQLKGIWDRMTAIANAVPAVR